MKKNFTYFFLFFFYFYFSFFSFFSFSFLLLALLFSFASQTSAPLVMSFFYEVKQKSAGNSNPPCYKSTECLNGVINGGYLVKKHQNNVTETWLWEFVADAWCFFSAQDKWNTGKAHRKKDRYFDDSAWLHFKMPADGCLY